MSIDIFSLLQTYPNNYHYLKRYYIFILSCIEANSSKSKEELGYTEKHHILPKSMFPDYKSFTQYPDNNATLTYRQHIIAHVLLWKAYPADKKMMYALWSMLAQNQTTPNRKIPLTIEIRYLENCKTEFSEAKKDKTGANNSFYGKKHSDESKLKISIANTGKKRTDDFKLKMSLRQTGTKRTSETKLKNVYQCFKYVRNS